LFLEDLPFDEQFGLSLFKAKSESEIYDTVLDPGFIADPFDEQFGLSLFKAESESEIYDTFLDPGFIADLEVQNANKSINEYILNSPFSTIIYTFTYSPTYHCSFIIY